jgi:hypothetical protein
MQIVATFNPALQTSGQFNSQLSRGGNIIVYNESAINLSVTFANGDSGYAPSGVATKFPMDAQPSPNVIWQQQSIVTTLSTPISQVLIEAYQPGEPITGTFPATLNRQTAVSNAVATTGGTPTSVVNDGNIPNTSVVEATVHSDITSAVILTNNGSLSLGTAANPGALSLVGSGGNLSVSTAGILTVANEVVANLLQAQSVRDLYFQCDSGQSIVFDVGGTILFAVNGSGPSLDNSSLNLIQGSLSRLSVFSGAAVNGSTLIAHGLGAVPSFVVLMPKLTSTPVAVTLGYDPASTTNVNVKVWASANFNIIGLAVAF